MELIDILFIAAGALVLLAVVFALFKPSKNSLEDSDSISPPTPDMPIDQPADRRRR